MCLHVNMSDSRGQYGTRIFKNLFMTWFTLISTMKNKFTKKIENQSFEQVRKQILMSVIDICLPEIMAGFPP